MRNWVQCLFRWLERSLETNTHAVQGCIERLETRRFCSHYVNGSHTFSDGAFLDTNWTSTPVTLGSGGVSSGVRVTHFGHGGGAFREVTDTVYSGSSDSYVFGFHGNVKALYNPVIKGAITSVYYSEFNKLISGFDEGERTGAALEQNGQIYFLLDQALDIPQATWKQTKAINLTAADFSTLDTGAHPDFSQAGGVIEFGFYRANSSGYSGYTIVAGMDNWVVRLKTRRFV